MTRFIHTADWQIGKPFARVEIPENRTRLRMERIHVIARIGQAARDHQASFVLVAGDLFDSTTPDKATVSATCKAIGGLGLPVIVIPGNHDHGGPGSCWEQEYFLREQAALAPNLKVLLTPEPFELEGVVILPCPLCRRQESADLTAWLRDPAVVGRLPAKAPRIVLAHGSTQGFSSVADGEEATGQSNLLRIEDLDPSAFDYIALGDWHGTKQVGPRAWYAGTPELDRFVKGGDHDPGNVLAVTLPGHGSDPVVSPVRTARLGWHGLDFAFVDDGSLAHLRAQLDHLVAGRVGEDLLRLSVSGSISFEGERGFQALRETLEGRLLRLKLENTLRFVPTEAELGTLSGRAEDPLVSALALRLRERLDTGQDADIARHALKELFVAINHAGKGN